MSDRDVRDLTEAVGILTATLDAAQARADAIVRWQHTYQESRQIPTVFGERIDPDDGHEFCGPWEPPGCAVDPHWQSRCEVVPTLVPLWRRPLRRVE